MALSSYCCALFVFVLSLTIASEAASSLVNSKNAADLVTQLPDLAMKVEHFAGFVNINQKQQRKLFYYYVPAKRNPLGAPVILWMQSSPTCSSMLAFMYEHGPFKFQLESPATRRMKITNNPYSWHQLANVIYLDVPSGIGFSFSKTDKGTAEGAAADVVQFLKGFYNKHPLLIKNDLYLGAVIGGVPTMLRAAQNIKARLPSAKLQGYVSIGGYMNECKYTDGAQPAWAVKMKVQNKKQYKKLLSKCNNQFCGAAAPGAGIPGLPVGMPGVPGASGGCMGIQFMRMSLPHYTPTRTPAMCRGDPEPARRRLLSLPTQTYYMDANDSSWASEEELLWTEVDQVVDDEGDVDRWDADEVESFNATSSERKLLAVKPKSKKKVRMGGAMTCSELQTAAVYFNRDDVRKVLHIPPVDVKDITTRWLACPGLGMGFRADTTPTFPRHKALVDSGLRVLFLQGVNYLDNPFTGLRLLVRDLGLPPTAGKGQQAIRDARNKQIAVVSSYGNNHQVNLVLVPKAGAFVVEDNPVVALTALHKFLSKGPIGV